ncbi:MAG TPA: glycine--tRNA ligase subunit beta [Elusimicrobia bacterium]|nr:glycine--tRNA ligase subunit beta [Elusimicrobiota bacterium]
MITRDALLEILIENIPARFVTSAGEQLNKYASVLLAEAGLPCEGIEAFGTYKRLTLYISGVPASTEDKIRKAYGPASRLLKDEKGNFTPQAAGFARARGTTPDKLGVETVPNKGEVLVFEEKIPGRPAAKTLSEIFPAIISKLQFPKNMVWEAGRFRFARPIRGLLALYGDKPVAFEIAGVKSGRLSVGLSARGSRRLSVPSAEKYFKLLENANVIVKDEERLKALRAELERVSKRMKLEVDIDEELLRENLYLVEYPVCVVGEYSQDFLKLPAELVHLVMKKQLKFFTVSDLKGRACPALLEQSDGPSDMGLAEGHAVCPKRAGLEPHFIGIRDGVSKGQRNVENGFKNVLEARFRDAVFFYSRDLAVPLDDFNAKLKSVTFQEKIGTMYDKTERVKKLAAWLCDNCGSPVNKEEVIKASGYVYADLVSNVVREFTELQGAMGYYYAKNAGFSEAASRAVGEFYWPLSAKSPLPSSAEGALVSMAGKLDTLAADFALEMVPTGSEDPYALRRQALGMARVILEKGFKINLAAAFERALELLPLQTSGFDAVAVKVKLLDFTWQRAQSIFEEEGFKFDEVKAVREFFMKAGDLPDCRARLKDMHAFRLNPDFAALAMAFKRAKNILRQSKNPLTGFPEEGLFEKEEEKILYRDIAGISGKLKGHLANRDYSKSLLELLSIKGSLDNFFEKVMVMAEDTKVRDNRLNLVKSLVSLFEDVADLSQLQ